MSAAAQHPLVIAGGGLAGCLAALALQIRRPDVPFLLIEQGDRLGGNHVWSFFDTDVAARDRALVDPLVSHRWEGTRVAFPGRERRLSTPYFSISSADLDAHVRAVLPPERLRLGADIASLDGKSVTLVGGERIAGSAVIDARGAGATPGLDLGWQKFLGQVFELEEPHGLAEPMLMDARVDQSKGYRFVYCLPFSPTRLLVEDTYYSTEPGLDRPEIRDRIGAYLGEQGWRA